MKYAALFALFTTLYAQDDPLPEGAGKKVVQKLCNECHGPENYTERHHDKSGWEKVINDMVEKGASGTDEELDIVVAYLTKNFGPEKKNR